MTEEGVNSMDERRIERDLKKLNGWYDFVTLFQVQHKEDYEEKEDL